MRSKPTPKSTPNGGILGKVLGISGPSKSTSEAMLLPAATSSTRCTAAGSDGASVTAGVVLQQCTTDSYRNTTCTCNSRRQYIFRPRRCHAPRPSAHGGSQPFSWISMKTADSGFVGGLDIDHFSATKLVGYAWSLLLARAAADDPLPRTQNSLSLTKWDGGCSPSISPPCSVSAL